jgi:hypothetical protein
VDKEKGLDSKKLFAEHLTLPAERRKKYTKTQNYYATKFCNLKNNDIHFLP